MENTFCTNHLQCDKDIYQQVWTPYTPQSRKGSALQFSRHSMKGQAYPSFVFAKVAMFVNYIMPIGSLSKGPAAIILPVVPDTTTTWYLIANSQGPGIACESAD